MASPKKNDPVPDPIPPPRDLFIEPPIPLPVVDQHEFCVDVREVAKLGSRNEQLLHEKDVLLKQINRFKRNCCWYLPPYVRIPTKSGTCSEDNGNPCVFQCTWKGTWTEGEGNEAVLNFRE